MKNKIFPNNRTINIIKSLFWFLTGIFIGLFFTLSFGYILFEKIYGEKIFPGIYINNIQVGGKSEKEVEQYFINQNMVIEKSTFTFSYNDNIATTSAKNLKIGYNSKLLAHQAYLIGRSNYFFSDVVLISKAYISGLFLSPSYEYDESKLEEALSPIYKSAYIMPVDAQFVFENGKVTTFQASSVGQEINIPKIKQAITNIIPTLITIGKNQSYTIPLETIALKPKIATEDANNLGIKELIGTGTSLFQHSIPERIFNVTLASTRLNGILVAPDEEFSFDKALGDVSKFTGYQSAYVIQNGKTVLGDGGGICQVSTTLFRALLSAGLPVTERHGHAYRVGYYEEDSPPGIDATVFVPSVDLKFKNDTGHHILIQTAIDPSNLRLTFFLYGTFDGRKVTTTTPVVTSQTPAPPALYTDDPTLPKGVIKQIDFAANGASVTFDQTVTKNNKVIYQQTFNTNYQPWQASFLRGTKQN